jgi:hypothetical protein
MHDAEGSGGREHAAERPQSCGGRGGHRRAVALVALVAAQTLSAVGAQPSGSKPHIGGGDWDDRFGPMSIQSDIARYARQQQARKAQRATSAPVSTPYAASGSWAGGWGLHTDKVIGAPGVTVVPSGKSIAPETTAHPRRQAGSKEPAAAPSSRLDVHSETASASGNGLGAALAHQSPTAAPNSGGETWMEQDIEREMEDDGSITGEPNATPDSPSEHASSYTVPRPGEKNARKPRHGESEAGAPRPHPRGNHSQKCSLY